MSDNYKNLKKWIAGSEAYVTSQRFGVRESDLPKIPFLDRQFDFYLGLMGRATELLRDTNPSNDEQLTDFKNIAKGLNYFLSSNGEDIDGYKGKYENIFKAIIAFLGEDYTTSILTIKQVNIDELEGDPEKLIVSLLSKKGLGETELGKSFLQYYHDGNGTFWSDVSKIFPENASSLPDINPEEYLFVIFSRALLAKILKCNVRSILSELIPQQSINQYLRGLDSEHFLYLFPSQISALKSGILSKTGVFSLQTPTSSGKTALCELVIYFHKKNFNGKTLFLVPFRALATELKGGMAERLVNMGLKVETMYGGSFKTGDDFSDFALLDLLIITPEKFRALSQFDSSIVDVFDMMICDEGHLLESEGRGLDYELTLTGFKSKKLESRKIVYMSAIIPNIEDVHLWLNGTPETIVRSNYRAAELKFALVVPMYKKLKNNKRKIHGYTMEVNPTKVLPEKYWVYNFLSESDYTYVKESTGRRNTYNLSSNIKSSVAVGLKSLNFGKVAIFTTQKNHLKSLVNEAVEQSRLLQSLPSLEKYTNSEAMLELSHFVIEFIGKDFDLAALCIDGVLYHHGDLPQLLREKIELSVRSGFCSFLVCTSTLAEGVNLPVDTLVLHTVRRFRPPSSMEYLSRRDVKNIVGRAGRAGFSNKGMVISSNTEEFNFLKKIALDDGIEPIKSYFYQTIKYITNYCEVNNLSPEELIRKVDSFEFWKIIDSIDETILSSVDDSGVSIEKVVQLYEQTYAFTNSSDSEKEIIRDFFQLRAKEVDASEVSPQVIKKSGCTPRLFNELGSLINLADIIDLVTVESETMDYFDYFWSVSTMTTQMQFVLNEFCLREKVELNFDTLKKGILYWMQGANYLDVAEVIQLTLDCTLKLFNRVVTYNLNTMFGKISNYLDSALNSEITVEEFQLNYQKIPLYLEVGIKNRYQYILHSLGLRDRIAIHCLYSSVMEAWSQSGTKSSIKSTLILQTFDILFLLDGSINKLSFEALEEWLEDLK